MERRQFVLSTVLGLLSTNTLIASSFKQDKKSENFIQLLGGKDLTLAQKNDPKLKEMVLESAKSFLDLGYTFTSNPQQLTTNIGEKQFFYWMVLEHPDLGLLDTTFLSFKMGINGNFVHIPPISGKLAESFTTAVGELSSTYDNTELMDLFIPSYDEHPKSEFYSTNRGKVYFKDFRGPEKSSIALIIYDGNRIIWEKNTSTNIQNSLMS